MSVKVVKSENKRNPLIYIFFSAVVVVFLAIFIFTISGIYADSALKRAELETINHEIKIQEMKTANLEAVFYNDEEFLRYATKVARDNDYVKSGERVFINSSGD